MDHVVKYTFYSDHTLISTLHKPLVTTCYIKGLDKKHFKIPQHLDVKSPRFDQEDLMKLIKQTTADLEEQDKQRKEDFKKYEMEKKFEKEMRLQAINDTAERKVVQEEMEKMEAKHRQHDKVKHPMTKDQLEEVWEEQDHMDPQDFDPKTFFMMHDLDGNGQWDENEVRDEQRVSQ